MQIIPLRTRHALPYRRQTFYINSLALALMAGLLASGLAAPQSSPPSITIHYESSDEDFPNPERGFHKNTDLLTVGDLQWAREQGFSLVRAYVRMDAFRDRPLSSEFLQKLRHGFAAVRAAGLKTLPVFAYNFPDEEDIKAGRVNDSPDAPLSLVKQHLRQLKPVLHENQDVIAALELGFVGAWGEWHSSRNKLDTPDNKKAVLEAILDALPKSRMMQLRYPGDVMTLFPVALNAKQAYKGSRQARTGWANMCFLSNPSDSGTYLPLNTKAAKQAYLEQMTRYVIVGGETCQLTPGESRGDCATTQAEMRRFHFSYINRDFYAPALVRWKQEGCLNTIAKQLGYRFRLTEATLPRNAAAGETLRAQFTLRNDGWAAPYNPRPVALVLRHKVSRHLLRFLLAADMRLWQAGETHEIRAAIRLPADAPTGEYEALLHFPDPMPTLATRPEYALRLANRDTWEPNTGYNRLLASMQVSR